MNSRNSRCVASWYATLSTAILVLVSLSEDTFAQVDSRYIEQRAARVVVQGTDSRGKQFAKASSGFLWKSKDQVVTSLHGVPSGGNIVVSCMGVSTTASVGTVLKRADLILLKLAKPLSACQVFGTANKTKPSEGTKLWTFGWHAGARGGSSRHFQKGYGSPEKLGYLVSGAPLKTLQTYNIPSTDLDIYYVQGGLLPGYSGGPVVNANKELVGVVDGGLNKGTSDYNWVIPAKYLDELESSSVKTIPVEVAKMSGLLFSSEVSQSQSAPAQPEPIAPLFTTGTVEAEANAVVAYEVDGQYYEWVKTKTASLYELGQTADDADGVYQLVTVFGNVAGVSAYEQLVFDVYEELNLGLVITVPKDQPLEYTVMDDDYWLVSINSTATSRFSGTRFDHDGWDINDAYNRIVDPADPAYFQNSVAELLIDCHTPLVTYCQLDQQSLRIVDFGGGNKILKLGMTRYDYKTRQALSYDYYSFAVRNNIPFGAQSTITSDASAGLIQCMTSTTNQRCENTAPARRELAQLIAAHLTTFSGLANNHGKLEVFQYDSSADYPKTYQVPFLEDGELRLYNTRGIQWKLYLPGEEEQLLVEYRARQDGYVFLKPPETNDQFVSFMEDGGDYYLSTDGTNWNKNGVIQRAW